MPSKKEIEQSLRQLRRIEEHREVGAEKEIRRIYKNLLKDLKQFVGYEYAELAEDGKLTYDILQRKGQFARFLDEVEQRLNGLTPAVSKEITALVEDTYKLAYEGMVEAVSKSKNSKELRSALEGLQGVSPEVIKAAVENPVAGLTLKDTLEKNRREIIYDIKRAIGVGLANGDRAETMAKRISKSLDGDYQKAVRIARTETHRVREAGLHDSAKALDDTIKEGVSENRMVKIWKTMKDARVRDSHASMNEQTVLVDESFILPGGDKTNCPGSSGIASEDINCRCYVSYDLMNDEEYYKATGRHFKKEEPEEPTEEEVEALKDYTGIFGKIINSYMYGTSNSLTEYEKNIVDVLHGFLDRQSLPKDMTLFRGQSPSIFGKQAEAILKDPQKAVGKTFVNKAFLSTSTNRKVAGMFQSVSYDKPLMFVIHAPKGAKGMNLGDISVLNHEKEYLFIDHVKLKVLKAVEKNGSIFMECDLLTD